MFSAAEIKTALKARSLPKDAQDILAGLLARPAPVVNVPETVINVPETTVVNNTDFKPLQKALEANTKQMADMTKAMLASLTAKQTKGPWAFEVERDQYNGLIKGVTVKPDKETVN